MAEKKKSKYADKPYKVGRGKPPPGFKKGKEWNGNKLGGAHPNHPTQDPVKKQLAKLTSSELHEVITLLLQSNTHEVEELAKNKNAPYLRRWIATVAVEAVKDKSFGVLERLFDRSIGPVPAKVEQSGPGGGPIQSELFSLTAEERKKAIEDLRRERERNGEE